MNIFFFCLKFSVLRFMAVAMILAFPWSGLGQVVIFNDSFDLDPSVNGWVEGVTTTNTAAGSIHVSGIPGQAVIDKNGGSGRVQGTISRTISTLGFENIDLELIAFQSATSFEGGGVAGVNTDYLSVLIDTGGGFVSLFERTGVWGTPGGLGFSDGGSGAGQTIATSSGIFSLGAGAANNPALMIQILGQVTANAEDYFLDWFNLRGTTIAIAVTPVLPATSMRRRSQVATSFLLSDVGAIQSVMYSGLPMGLIHQQIVQAAPEAALADLNGRLFRARAGRRDVLGSSMASSDSGTSSLLRYFSFIENQRMSYKVALGLAEAEGLVIEVNSGDKFSGSLPYAMMGVPLSSLMGGMKTVHIVEAAPSGKVVIDDDSKVVVESKSQDRWQLFATGDFSFYDQNQLSDLMRGFDTDTYAGSVGIEYRVLNWLNLGLAWSYLESNSQVAGDLGNIDLEGNLISAYATAFWQQNWVDLLYSYGSLNSEINRNTGLGGRGRADADSQNHNVRLNFGRNISVGKRLVTGPVAGLRYGTGGTDPYSERGGASADLNYLASDFESMVSRLGWQASHFRSTTWGRLVSQVHLTWEHEYLPENGAVGVSLQTSPFALVTGDNIRRVGGFSTESDGAQPGTDWMSVGCGLRFELRQGFAILTDYEGAFFRSNATQHFGSLKVSYEW
ncbi:MAG: autotransporter outer membrane beta-barrel domain-containing protein [Verrucomicrobia bacterium]|nr:autotransporter outer membrane beta-barrel domain-containing protein [Verrucomicrobiota bacterium]